MSGKKDQLHHYSSKNINNEIIGNKQVNKAKMQFYNEYIKLIVIATMLVNIEVPDQSYILRNLCKK